MQQKLHITFQQDEDEFNGTITSVSPINYGTYAGHLLDKLKGLLEQI